LSVRADGVRAVASSPVSLPCATPAPPRSTASAYGLRFCGISTLARHSEASNSR
jgi:hypothetical protein